MDENAKPLAEFNAGDGHQRYYFPSSRALDGNNAVSSDSIKEESKESESRSTLDTSVDEVVRLKATTGSRMSMTFAPLHLSAAPRTPTTPISEILTPVSEPAFLLASICSTMEKLPLSLATPTDPPQDSALLQTYLRERAVQDARVKQSQYHPRLRREGPSSEANTPVGTPGTPTSSTTLTLSYSNSMNQIEPGRNSICTTTFTSVSQMISTSSCVTPQDIATTRPPPLVWAVQKANKPNDSDTTPITSVNQCIPSTTTSGVTNLVIPNPPTSPVLIKQEKVLSPVKSGPMSSHMHSTPSIVLSGTRSRTSSETDVGSDFILQSGHPTDSRTLSDVKPDPLPPPPAAGDGKTSTTQTVITIVTSSGNDTFALPVTKPSEEATISSGTIGSLPSSNSVIVTSSGSSSPPLPLGSVPKKPKAEFMPPSSGPAPSYVR